jgi:carbon storage regulator CsrA
VVAIGIADSVVVGVVGVAWGVALALVVFLVVVGVIGVVVVVVRRVDQRRARTACETLSTEARMGLVITRKENESFLIGKHIRVTLGEVRNGRAKLVIDAPRLMRISREKRRKTDAQKRRCLNTAAIEV